MRELWQLLLTKPFRQRRVRDFSSQNDRDDYSPPNSDCLLLDSLSSYRPGWDRGPCVWGFSLLCVVIGRFSRIAKAYLARRCLCARIPRGPGFIVDRLNIISIRVVEFLRRGRRFFEFRPRLDRLNVFNRRKFAARWRRARVIRRRAWIPVLFAAERWWPFFRFGHILSWFRFFFWWRRNRGRWRNLFGRYVGRLRFFIPVGWRRTDSALRAGIATASTCRRVRLQPVHRTSKSCDSIACCAQIHRSSTGI